MPSVGSKGDSYDNALAETVNGLYKAELAKREVWPHARAVELATASWVEWWNTERLYGPLGYVPSAEYEARFLAGAVQSSARRAAA